MLVAHAGFDQKGIALLLFGQALANGLAEDALGPGGTAHDLRLEHPGQLGVPFNPFVPYPERALT
jgi:hypothetical protein